MAGHENTSLLTLEYKGILMSDGNIHAANVKVMYNDNISDSYLLEQRKLRLG